VAAEPEHESEDPVATTGDDAGAEREHDDGDTSGAVADRRAEPATECRCCPEDGYTQQPGNAELRYRERELKQHRAPA
jgi:hypothetical protein